MRSAQHERVHTPNAAGKTNGEARRRHRRARVSSPSHPLAMTLDTVIEFTGIRRTALFDAMREGRLPARKVGTRNIILYADLVDFLESLPVREVNYD